MIPITSVRDIDVRGKRVLCRFDFNVPIKDGIIGDDWRLKAALPTIQYLIGQKARIIMMSHLDRPGGKKVEKLTLAPIAMRLGELLGKEVKFVDEIVGQKVVEAAKDLKEGELLLLENTRFHQEENTNDSEFVGKLASLATVYINDAFGTAHRKHASTYGVAIAMKERAAGLLMLKEVENLSKLLMDPPAPFSLILGGAKLKTKIPVIKNLAHSIDNLIIGGGMAFSFQREKGVPVGDSLVDETLFPDIEALRSILEENNVRLILPLDAVIAEEIGEGVDCEVVDIGSIPSAWKGVDIGPATIEYFTSVIIKSKTVFWNGPMGVFEIPPFDKGTLEIAKAIGKATERGSLTIVGGGDTGKAIKGRHIELSHLSTGGGASLRFLTGEELPAISVLKKER